MSNRSKARAYFDHLVGAGELHSQGEVDEDDFSLSQKALRRQSLPRGLSTFTRT